MEKIMVMNGFQALDEKEIMETEGGIPWLIIPIAIGLSTILTGCSRHDQIHTQAGCTSTECLAGWGEDCPLRD